MTSHPNRSKSALDRIENGSFAEACFDQNSIAELEDALAFVAADATDCNTWGISPGEWRRQITLALAAKREAAQDR